MIVARIYKNPSKPGDTVKGSCRLAGYPDNHGWFPATSFNFGFKESDTRSQRGGNAGGSGASSRGGAAPRSGSSSGAATGAGEDGSNFSDMTISKEVDAATLYLMMLAMEERQSKKGTEQNLLADIHVLSSVEIEKQVRHLYASLMIHLEGVQVTSWEISGSGDDRPTENVRLIYDKAALYYQLTSKAKDVQPIGPKGWDQTKNQPWSQSDWKYQGAFDDYKLKF